jgi:hypothetical protein
MSIIKMILHTDVNFDTVFHLNNPGLRVLKENHSKFIVTINKITVIDVQGIDNKNCRIITTFLQGDNASGLIAIHQWLISLANTQYKRGLPATNIRIILCPSNIACETQLLTWNENIVANKENTPCCANHTNILALLTHSITEVSPQAIVYLQNTSMRQAPFSIATSNNAETLSLAALFSQTLVFSQSHIGYLLARNFHCPAISVQCGQEGDYQSFSTALIGIQDFTDKKNILNHPLKQELQLIHKPLRLKLKANTPLSFATENTLSDGVILQKNIETLNYKSNKRNAILGWINNAGLEDLILLDEHQYDVITDYFSVINNTLLCADNLQIFLATDNIDIAKGDCLFYVIKISLVSMIVVKSDM